MPTPDGPSNDPDIGRVLDGRFELTEFVAKGGMGKVYKATQRPLDRVVAIKLLNAFGAADEEFRKRFFLEASLCARLSHPNVVRIYDFGCDQGVTYYIAMEFLAGQTLKQRIQKRGPLPPSKAIRILEQVCSALVEAHGQGLVHRDLKSSNLMLSAVPNQEDFVKIVDFGIVKELAPEAEITMTGALLGSPGYMSPEQINDADVDARSDIYSLGIILFQMLTGTLPFVHAKPVHILLDHLDTPPPSLSAANPGVQVPASLEDVVQTCLKKARENRYQTVEQLLDALAQCAVELGRQPVIDSHSDALDDAYTPEAMRAMSDLETQAIPSPLLDLPGSQDEPFATHDEPFATHDEPFASQAEPTGIMPTPLTTPAEPTGIMPMPIEADSNSLGSTIMARLQDSQLRGYVGFIDFNCPFCYALHERMTQWGLVDSLEWCMVEHVSHIMEGPYDLHQEQVLAKEVFAVHHRAPDIELQLPSTRCDSRVANRLVVLVQREFSDQLSDFRGRLYRALWQQGLDIADTQVLSLVLEESGLPPYLLEMCDEDPPEIEAWQSDWENADFDCCIPVISHPASSRVLIGLATQRTLVEFLLQERSRVVDSSVCYYQQQPVILICGWMSHLWPLLSEVRKCAEVLQAPSARHAMEMLSDKAVPDLLLIEDEHVEPAELEPLAELARSRSVHWALATRNPSPETEVRALSMGAAEYLPFAPDPTVARARLSRIMRDRFSADRLQREHETDSLTGLTSRRQFIQHLEQEWERATRSGDHLSFILMDLDRFKAFNDLHGYMAGNKALTQIARMLQAAVQRPGDRLARFGGNEFAVLLPATDEAEARTLAERLRTSVSHARIEHDADTGLSMSIGVASLKADPDGSIHLLHDRALADLRRSRGPGQ
ncbi:MAG: diguanylate cyclase [Myxococcota bacterium]|nr:diguanylate cyclase [Myxococcota bacterium]